MAWPNRKYRSSVPENERVFENEEHFLSASDEIKKNSLGWVLIYNETKYYVWAATKSIAQGLLARKLKLFQCVTFKKSRKFNGLNLDAGDVNAILATLDPAVLAEIKHKMTAIICPHCKIECKSKAGLTQHKKTNHKEEYEKEIAATFPEA